MSISPYYLKWILAMAGVYVAIIVLAARIDSPQATESWLLGPFIVAVQNMPWWRIALAIVLSSIVAGLAYGWLFRKAYHALRRRIRQRR